MNTRGLVGVAAAAIVVWLASPAVSASPGSLTIGPSNTSGSWSGKSFVLGTTASPSLCPASADPLNTLCDHLALSSSASSSYWSTHSGSATVSISWASSSDNFDLYVYSSGG